MIKMLIEGVLQAKPIVSTIFPNAPEVMASVRATGEDGRAVAIMVTAYDSASIAVLRDLGPGDHVAVSGWGSLTCYLENRWPAASRRFHALRLAATHVRHIPEADRHPDPLSDEDRGMWPWLFEF